MKRGKWGFALRRKFVRGFESGRRRAAEWTRSVGRMTPRGDSARFTLAAVAPIFGFILGLSLFPETMASFFGFAAFAAAITYVVASTLVVVALTWLAMARASGRELREWARFQHEPRSMTERLRLFMYGRRVFGGRTGFFTLISYSVGGLSGALFLIPAVRVEILGLPLPFVYVASILGVLATWSLLHTAFALQYAYLFYDPEDSGGLDFPGDEDPAAVDFAYFAFAVATSFAASDVRVTKRRMRRPVMIHGVLAFFYNTAVFALVVNIILSSI